MYYELPIDSAAANPAAYLVLILTALDAALYPEAFIESDQERAYGEIEDLKAWFIANFEGCA